MNRCRFQFLVSSQTQSCRGIGCRSAFTLVEMMTVVSITFVLMALTGPALRTMISGNSVNRAVSDFSSTLTMARTYAMANNTYVRVVMAKTTYGPSGATRLVILPIYSADGSLDQDGSADMRDAAKWPALSQAVVLDQMELNETVNATAPSTQSDALPGDTGSDIADFNRRAPGLGNAELPFNACIQFQPSGEARVSKGIPARYIKIAVDGSGALAGRNPFILRVSGASGSVDVLRVGEGM